MDPQEAEPLIGYMAQSTARASYRAWELVMEIRYHLFTTTPPMDIDWLPIDVQMKTL